MPQLSPGFWPLLQLPSKAETQRSALGPQDAQWMCRNNTQGTGLFAQLQQRVTESLQYHRFIEDAGEILRHHAAVKIANIHAEKHVEEACFEYSMACDDIDQRKCQYEIHQGKGRMIFMCSELLAGKIRCHQFPVHIVSVCSWRQPTVNLSRRIVMYMPCLLPIRGHAGHQFS